jgi:hypothetical protein
MSISWHSMWVYVFKLHVVVCRVFQEELSVLRMSSCQFQIHGVWVRFVLHHFNSSSLTVQHSLLGAANSGIIHWNKLPRRLHTGHDLLDTYQRRMSEGTFQGSVFRETASCCKTVTPTYIRTEWEASSDMEARHQPSTRLGPALGWKSHREYFFESKRPKIEIGIARQRRNKWTTLSDCEGDNK